MENKKIDEECVMPDYKEMYEEAARQADYWKQECQRQSFETVYLRGVKHTLEAIIGRKIGEGIIGNDK